MLSMGLLWSKFGIAEFNDPVFHSIDNETTIWPTSQPSSTLLPIKLSCSINPHTQPKDVDWFVVSSLILLKGMHFSISKEVVKSSLIESFSFEIIDVLSINERPKIIPIIHHTSYHHRSNSSSTIRQPYLIMAFCVQFWTRNKVIALQVLHQYDIQQI